MSSSAGLEIGFKRQVIQDEQAWVFYCQTYPSDQVDAKFEPPKFPCIVLSQPLGRNNWLHHFFTQSDAHQILGGDGNQYISKSFRDGIIHQIKFDALASFEDERGHLTEMFRKDDVQRWSREGYPRIETPPMAYVSMTKAGTTRGPHEHAAQTDIFIFMKSRFVVYLWDNRVGSPTFWVRQRLETDPSAYTRLVVPPGIVHAYKALDVDGTVVNCPDQLYKGWDKKKPVDEIRHEEDDRTVFVPWD